VSQPTTVDDFVGEHHVYQPHRAGLPPLRPYFREFWRRREFAFHLARTNLRAENYNTTFGKVWLVLNPMLLGVVYFLLIDIISGGANRKPVTEVIDGKEITITPGLSFAHLLAGLFLYYFFSGTVSTGTKSVTSGGKLILNMAFPRSLLPLSSTIQAFFRFLPTFVVLIVVGLVVHMPWSPLMLLGVVVVACIAMFAYGLAMIFATMQVYFRDTSSFLPYLLRIWLYLTPILYFASQVPSGVIGKLYPLNPLFPTFRAWSDLLIVGTMPPLLTWLSMFAWSIGTLVVGQLLFMSRERDFAVRL
jgi:teichoic acid transport system permease protein